MENDPRLPRKANISKILKNKQRHMIIAQQLSFSSHLVGYIAMCKSFQLERFTIASRLRQRYSRDHDFPTIFYGWSVAVTVNRLLWFSVFLLLLLKQRPVQESPQFAATSLGDRFPLAVLVLGAASVIRKVNTSLH